MKITCECGTLVHDLTDGQPNKAHLIPDPAWFPLFDRLDEIIAAAAAGRMTPEQAMMAARKAHHGSRAVWQCGKCGRLLVDDLGRQVQFFIPSNPAVDKRILRAE